VLLEPWGLRRGGGCGELAGLLQMLRKQLLCLDRQVSSIPLALAHRRKRIYGRKCLAMVIHR